MDDYNNDGVVDHNDEICFYERYGITDSNDPLYDETSSYLEFDYIGNEYNGMGTGSNSSGCTSPYSSSRNYFKKRDLKAEAELDRKTEIRDMLICSFVFLISIVIFLFFAYYLREYRFAVVFNIVMIILFAHSSFYCLSRAYLFIRRIDKPSIHPMILIIAFELVILASIPVIRFIRYYINYLIECG